MRQCPDRYTIRAGQNLPDKEFRYLRTVIVTAAVYRGFNSKLSLLLLTFRHRAGVSPYTSSFDLAETCVFAKQSPGPILCGSVTTLLPLALGFSPHLPVSVCGTGASDIPHTFSRRRFGLLHLFTGLTVDRVFHSTRSDLRLRVSVLKSSAVTEFLPCVHRLRLSASP